MRYFVRRQLRFSKYEGQWEIFSFLHDYCADREICSIFFKRYYQIRFYNKIESN